MIDANPTNFPSEVLEASHDRPVLVVFWAPWSEPSRELTELLERVERDADGALKLVKVDADDHPALQATWRVRGLPTVIAFRSGQPIDRMTGSPPLEQVRGFIARLGPPPAQDLLAQARARLAAADWAGAAGTLRTALALNPALDPVRALYVRTLLRLGHTELARHALAPIRDRSRAGVPGPALAWLLEAAEDAAGDDDLDALQAAVVARPDDAAARLRLARWLALQERWPAAMDELLELAARGRSSADDRGRRGLLAAFALVDDAALVRDYRRRLAATLH